MPLDAAIGGANANSFVLVTDVDAYIASHFVPPSVAAKWVSLTTAQKEAALISAAQLLDRHVKWTGEIASDTQALSWPRFCVLDRYGREIASTIIPTFLKEFQIQTALWIVDQTGVIPQVGNAEFESVRVGSLEIDFNEQGGVRRSMLPEEVVAALRPMGIYYAEIPGAPKTVSLLRA